MKTCVCAGNKDTTIRRLFKVAVSPIESGTAKETSNTLSDAENEPEQNIIRNEPERPRKSTQDEAKVIPRTIGLLTGTTLVIGCMIGSGIFISPTGILQYSGSVGLSFCIWAGSGLIAILAALCYIELGLLVPESGSGFAYLLAGFGPLHPFLGPLPAFLFSWTTLIVIRPAGIAVKCLVWAQYCVTPFYAAGTSPPPVVVPLTAVAICMLVTLVNCFSTKLGGSMQSIFTLAGLISTAVIVGAGAYSLVQGNTKYLATGFQGTTSSAANISKAFYNGLWAYEGWDNLNTLTEEVIKPARNLPLAILIALPTVTIGYLLTNVAYLTELSPEEVLSSKAVASSFADKILGPATYMITIGVALAVLGSINGSVIGSARCIWASSRRGHLPGPLSYINRSRLTPIPALFLAALVSIVMMCLLDIGRLINFFGFSMWIFYGLVVSALIVMRRTEPDRLRILRVPIVVPWLVVLMSGYLVISPIVESPAMEHLYVLVYILLGVLVYTLFVYYKWTLPCTQGVYAWIQRNLALIASA